MTGVVVVWSCYCSDAADHASWLPETCPGHDARRVCDPVINRRPGGLAAGHRCSDERKCAA